jgi:tyrosyl-tRNA synthetase
MSALLRASVKGKLNSPEGIDAASFLYQAVQAYDFYQLHHHNGCQLQIGGSDQWGNITAGVDLIEKLSPETKGTSPQLSIVRGLCTQERRLD